VIPGDRPFLGGRNRQPDRPIVPGESGRALGGRSPLRFTNFITRSVVVKVKYPGLCTSQTTLGHFSTGSSLNHLPAPRRFVGYRVVGPLYTRWMGFLPKRYTPTLTLLWSAACVASWWNQSKNLTCRLTPTMRLPTISSARSAGSCSGLDPRTMRRHRSRKLDQRPVDSADAPDCAPGHPAIT